jgi:hypothetical protein
VELYVYSPNTFHDVVLNEASDTSSWRGTSLSTRTAVPFTFTVINYKDYLFNDFS